MKLIAVLCGVLAVVFAVEQATHKLPPTIIKKAEAHGAACAAEHNVDPDLLYRTLDGTLPRDDASNKFLYCVALKTGVITEDGHLAVDKLVNLLGAHPKAGEFKEAITKCNDITKDNPVATIVEMNRCLTGPVPIRFIW